MKHTFLTFLAALLFCAAYTNAQDRKLMVHAVAFYNLENLFDTCHDEHKNDYDFLPDGSYHWDENKYSNKLANMARVICDLGTDILPYGASVIGVSEVENDKALDDLMAVPCMQQRGYKYVHFEGPDARGVDCALIYNPKAFQVTKAFHKLYVYENNDTARATRPFLCVQGKLAGDNLTVIVCHWPSRAAEGVFRDAGGRQVRALTDSIRLADPSQHIMVMGDMNDDPDNTSMAKYLGAKRKMKDVEEGDFYNPWWDVLRGKGQGTLSYQGGWNLFDQIVLSRNMLDVKGNKDYKELTLYNYHIFKRDYLIQQDGKYKGTPKRTTSGGVWQNGFSDHLPTVTYLVKAM
ncbi:MAG: endonuclease/exonuclease/phosphatase family protein [Bacteroidaceae bacterium]|nr:endonuclease/exonuclease/phosphatase family protein [Bacteroidaceae bacterium]